MAKKLTTPSFDSSLSPVADDLIAQVETTTNTKKRKADTTEVTVTNRTKATTLKTEVADVDTSANDSPRPKRGATKKVKIEEETVKEEIELQEDSKGRAKVTKKTTTRKKKEIDTSPLAERTQDTPLVLGAHVSAAGG
jgi:AP endonuclease-1